MEVSCTPIRCTRVRSSVRRVALEHPDHPVLGTHRLLGSNNPNHLGLVYNSPPPFPGWRTKRARNLPSPRWIEHLPAAIPSVPVPEGCNGRRRWDSLFLPLAPKEDAPSARVQPFNAAAAATDSPWQPCLQLQVPSSSSLGLYLPVVLSPIPRPVGGPWSSRRGVL